MIFVVVVVVVEGWVGSGERLRERGDTRGCEIVFLCVRVWVCVCARVWMQGRGIYRVIYNALLS